jgi:hypothetical protein
VYAKNSNFLGLQVFVSNILAGNPILPKASIRNQHVNKYLSFSTNLWIFNLLIAILKVNNDCFYSRLKSEYSAARFAYFQGLRE